MNLYSQSTSIVPRTGRILAKKQQINDRILRHDVAQRSDGLLEHWQNTGQILAGTDRYAADMQQCVTMNDG